jgi:hypothetical protein
VTKDMNFTLEKINDSVNDIYTSLKQVEDTLMNHCNKTSEDLPDEPWL